jgi:membrane-bound lytic murein transglycosylase D
MGTNVKKVWNISKRTLFVGFLIQAMLFDSASFAFAPAMSASDLTMPQFWQEQAPPETGISSPALKEPWDQMRSRVLNDEANRISEDFKIPEPLRQRTEFWFDIYTRYGSNEHIIHHVLYPWIVFKVIDTNEMVATGKGPEWLRKDRAEKFVRGEARAIRKSLHKLARMKNYDNLAGLEKDLFEKLQSLPGTRRHVFREAARNVRKQLGQRDFFRNGLVNSSRYLPYMEKQFEDQGLPVELTRIPFVESSFNELAFSRAGASGIWQIMPYTGRSFMIVTPTIDERNSPIKASQMAARLLKQIYRGTKSWDLAVTSYNHGIGNLRKAMRRAHSKDLATIIKRYHRGDFKFASSNYYVCFLAALHAEKYNEMVFNDLSRQPLQESEVVFLKHKTSLSQILKLTGLSRDQLLSYNLDLKSVLAKRVRGALPRGFELHVPKGLAQAEILGSHQTSKIRQTSI